MKKSIIAFTLMYSAVLTGCAETPQDIFVNAQHQSKVIGNASESTGQLTIHYANVDYDTDQSVIINFNNQPHKFTFNTCQSESLYPEDCSSNLLIYPNGEGKVVVQGNINFLLGTNFTHAGDKEVQLPFVKSVENSWSIEWNQTIQGLTTKIYTYHEPLQAEALTLTLKRL